MRKGPVALHVSVRQFQRVKRRFVAEGRAGCATGCAAGRRRGGWPGAARPGGGVLQSALRRVERLPRHREAAGGGGPAAQPQLSAPAAPRPGPARQTAPAATPGAHAAHAGSADGRPRATRRQPLRVAGRRAARSLTLHGAIDDATGAGLALVFRPTEDLHGYVTLLQQLCTTYGRPLALYGDRFGVFRPQRSALVAGGTTARPPRSHPLRPHAAGPRHRLHRRALAPGQGPHRAVLADPARSPRQRTAPARHRHLEAANAFLPDFLADLTPPLRAPAGRSPCRLAAGAARSRGLDRAGR